MLMNVKIIGYGYVFEKKWNENGEIVWYKVRLVSQGFLQTLVILFEETNSLIFVATMFWYRLTWLQRKVMEEHCETTRWV